MVDYLKNKLSAYYTNLRGWKTNRKIIVIESDDWGSIRMPSRKVYNKCLKAGYPVDKISYERFDTLESRDDLVLLFELLNSFKDINRNHPVITANVLVANPDFKRIKDSGFKEYFYESVTDTFARYPGSADCLEMWKKGLEDGLFYPQSHGREHLNVSLFMEALQNEDQDVHFGFKHEIPGCIPMNKSPKGNKYVETLRYSNQKDKQQKLKITIEGLELFEELLGFCSESFIPPNYIWCPDYDEKISEKGVKFYQGNRTMKEPMFDDSTKLHSHRLGQKNKYGQTYLVRNAVFEPSFFNSSNDPVNNCLRDINIAFRMKKPAIICSHRLNYVGSIDAKNRDENLKLLQDLLKNIIKKWPDVEFMNSVQLGKLIEKGKN